MVHRAIAYLSLGSNMGDKLAHLEQARRRLRAAEGVSVLRESPLYLTRPVGKLDQEWFLNQVLEIATNLEPYALLELCQDIEQALGRVRHERWGPRTLDIDILLYDNLSSSDPVLTLPHPRMLARAFVLVPLADLNPELEIEGKSVGEHLRRLPDVELEGVRLYTGTGM